MPRSKPSSFLNELLSREYKENNVRLSKKIVNDRLKFAQNLYNKNFLAHYGCVNAIEFLNGGQFLASGGDDRRVLIWNVLESLQGVGSPHAMRAQHVSNIFCLGFDSKNTKLFSAGNDDQVIVHDIRTGDPIDFFLYEQPIYGLSVDPSNDDVFACACDDGSILIYDIRAPPSTEPFVLARSITAYHGVMYNPVESRLLATANAKDGACLWDSRQPKEPLLKYALHSCMSVRWNNNGTQILALRRRMPPVLYGVDSPENLVQFDHPGYFNSCTMKSCCFAGYDNEYVLSGSDDFNLYMWKIPTLETKGKWVSSAHLVLGGHRSIVNQVRFNPDNYLIASSGVEKLIKIWSPFPLPWSSGGLEKDSFINKSRRVFSHEEYITLVMRSGQIISHDYSHESTKEDPRMMAFFDSLVQREIEGWSSDESLSDVSPVYSDRSVPGSDDNHNDNNVNNGESNDNVDNENEEGDESDEGDNNVNNCENENDNNDSNAGLVRKKRKNCKSNPIVKLIAKKRAQLMRLANKTNNQSNKTNYCCGYISPNVVSNINSNSNINTRSNVSSSSSSSTSSSSSDSDSAASSCKRNSCSSDSSDVISSMSDNSCDSDLPSNRRKEILFPSIDSDNHLSCDTDEQEDNVDKDSDNDIVGEENNNENDVSKIDCVRNNKRKKKLKKENSCFKIRKLAIKFGNVHNNVATASTVTTSAPSTDNITTIIVSPTSRTINKNAIENNENDNTISINKSFNVVQNLPTTSISQLCDDLITSNSYSTSTTPNSDRVKEIQDNQDSGIFLSDFNTSNHKNIDDSRSLKKAVKHSHRNYRKRIVDTDDSDS